ncbi:MAG TPA: aminotransferase class I/II-fold pyridoxal phosphate-dependent enzyme [Nitrospirota bacterium]|nr:aminotransferase class I/II-fold pyridoxal phosphate-dependent enzyme [Nitrospirota bacterium]
MKTSSRAQKLTPFFVMELLEQARAMEARGDHIVHMEIGEPDFSTPELIKNAAIEAIQCDRTFYTHSLGIPELRKLIADHYQQADGIHISPERVIITNGTSGAFLLLCSVLLEKGRSLALADPGYPCYKNFAALFDAEVTSIPVSEESSFEITEVALINSGKVPDILIISNPTNPTGTVYREGSINSLSKIFENSKRTFVVDEIYRGLYYGEKIRTALAVSDRIIVVDGFSKAFAMTGWRLGWMVVPEELVRPIQIVAQNVFISPPTLSQYAAIKAFDCVQEIEHMRMSYQERKDFLLPELRRLGFRIEVDPEGAFYIYAGIELWNMDSREFADRALKEAKVALTPGYDFGIYRAGSHVRFSYATSIDKLKLGCDRLAKWIKTLR